jgi:hypothetical protein
MGIFDDELGEGGEPWQIAQTVFDDLLSFMANNPHGNIDGPFDPITLRRRSSGDTLEYLRWPGHIPTERKYRLSDTSHDTAAPLGHQWSDRSKGNGS